MRFCGAISVRHYIRAGCAAVLLGLPPQLVAQTGPTLTLEATLERVRANHPVVAAAAARVDAAKGTRLTARLPLNPQFTYQQENIGFPGRSAPAGIDRETMAFVTLPLEPLYQLRPRSRQASGLVDAASADLLGVRQRVSLDAARAFYRVALAQVAVEASTDVMHWLDSLVNYTTPRVTEGAASEGDLIRLRVERDRAEMDMVMARSGLTGARSELTSYAGSAVGAVRWADTVATFVAWPEHARQTAVSSRPDVIAARARVAAASAGRSVERSAIVRELSLMLGEKSMSGTRSFMAGVMLPLPLFDQNRGERQRANGEFRAAEFEAEWVERQAVAQIQAAHEIAEALTAHAGSLRGGFLSRAEESRAIAAGAYREGAAPLAQVIDAARTFADARQAYYRVLFAQQQSVLELRVALGADLTQLSSTPDSR
jgi:cobalt-zinc-cadmium efflux system outer membrane protein